MTTTHESKNPARVSVKKSTVAPTQLLRDEISEIYGLTPI